MFTRVNKELVLNFLQQKLKTLVPSPEKIRPAKNIKSESVIRPFHKYIEKS